VIGEQFGVGLAIDFGHQVLRVADLGDVAQSEIKSGATANFTFASPASRPSVSV
jgi:hypothetical protein